MNTKDENTYVITKYDVSGIQDYIFATNRLKENVGASNNVRRILENLLPEAISKLPELSGVPGRVVTEWKGPLQIKDDPGILAEVVYIGGGNAVVIYRSKKLCNEASRLFAIAVTEACRGVGVFAAAVVTAFTDYENDLKKLNVKLEEIKRSVPRKTNGSPCPITEQDSDYGLPVTRTGEYGKNISSLQYEKQQAYGCHNKKLGPAQAFPVFMEEMAEHWGEDSYVAVVHIDGNGMGNLFNEKIKAKDYETAVLDCRELSNEIEKRTQCAYDLVLKGVKLSERNGKVPFRPLILDGDDFTFLCTAKLALPITVAYLRGLARQAKEDPELPYTGCAGIAFVHGHFPFQLAYQIAEQRCDAAKKCWYSEPDTAGCIKPGYLDFQIVRGTYNENTSDQEDRYRVRPCRVESEINEKDMRSVDSLFEILKNMTAEEDGKRKWPNSRLRHLYESFLLGPDRLKLMERELFSRNYKLSSLTGVKDRPLDLEKPCGIFDALEVLDFFDGQKLADFRAGEEKR